jgi:RNA polymerase sigma-70 factor (ECF subfamily)
MERAPRDQKLSSITTLWTVVCQAHGGSPEGTAAARRDLMERYGAAVHRYLLGALRDADAAEELAQEFALRFLRGDLRGADSRRGRFRDFVKGVLFHLVADHYRRQKGRPQPMPGQAFDATVPDPEAADRDRRFQESWRDELMSRAWNTLENIQRRTGQPVHTVLRFRAEHLDLRSPQMAERLSAELGKPVTAAWVRQTLHRAREKFADLLLQEVAQTLNVLTVEELQDELSDLGLLAYCEPALKRFRRDS